MKICGIVVHEVCVSDCVSRWSVSGTHHGHLVSGAQNCPWAHALPAMGIAANGRNLHNRFGPNEVPIEGRSMPSFGLSPLSTVDMKRSHLSMIVRT